MRGVGTLAALDLASDRAWAPGHERLARGEATASASLSLIIPPFIEAGNIVELLQRIATRLDGADWDVIVVDDDSADATADIVASLGGDDPRRHGHSKLDARVLWAFLGPLLRVILRRSGADLQVGPICNYAIPSALVWHRQPRHSHG